MAAFCRRVCLGECARALGGGVAALDADSDLPLPPPLLLLGGGGIQTNQPV